MKKVAIVNTKMLGTPEREDTYDGVIALLEQALKAARPGELEVRVFDAASEAQEWLAGEGSAVFVTADMFSEAASLASALPNVRVVLYSGGATEGKGGNVILTSTPPGSPQRIAATILGGLKIAILKIGGFGGLHASRGDYDRLAENIDAAVGHIAEVRIFTEPETALSEAKAWLGDQGTIVFLTAGMAPQADRLTKESPALRVVLYSTATRQFRRPGDTIVFVEKSNRQGPDEIRDDLLA